MTGILRSKARKSIWCFWLLNMLWGHVETVSAVKVAEYQTASPCGELFVSSVESNVSCPIFECITSFSTLSKAGISTARIEWIITAVLSDLLNKSFPSSSHNFRALTAVSNTWSTLPHLGFLFPHILWIPRYLWRIWSLQSIWGLWDIWSLQRIWGHQIMRIMKSQGARTSLARSGF